VPLARAGRPVSKGGERGGCATLVVQRWSKPDTRRPVAPARRKK
jgi:hypothetical protein